MGEVGASNAPNLYEVWEESMKVQITYRFTGGMFWAEGWDGKRMEFGASSESFEKAKARVIEKIQEFNIRKDITVPADEEVVI